MATSIAGNLISDAKKSTSEKTIKKDFSKVVKKSEASATADKRNDADDVVLDDNDVVLDNDDKVVITDDVVSGTNRRKSISKEIPDHSNPSVVMQVKSTNLGGDDVNSPITVKHYKKLMERLDMTY